MMCREKYRIPRITLLFGILVTFGLAASAPAQATETEKVFMFYCAQCHGADGKGKGPNVTDDFATNPRNFTDAEAMNKLTDGDMKTAIKDGGPAVSKSELMPPWGKTLSAEEIAGLVGYIRNLCGCEGKKE